MFVEFSEDVPSFLLVLGIYVVIIGWIIWTHISVSAFWVVCEIFILDQKYDLREPDRIYFSKRSHCKVRTLS